MRGNTRPDCFEQFIELLQSWARLIETVTPNCWKFESKKTWLYDLGLNELGFNNLDVKNTDVRTELFIIFSSPKYLFAYFI